ncbi:MAG TPA: hypothetical protein VF116_10115 [Ktedonobacterales bacterium]
MANENRTRQQPPGEPEEAGVGGMLGAAGTEPLPGLPEETSPIGVPAESPFPGPGVPPTAVGSPSTVKGTEVLGTPGDVGRARISDAEPGTPGVPGTPTPGPTGFEPNTIDTYTTGQEEGDAPAELANAQRVLHSEGGGDADAVRGREGGLTGGSPQAGVGGGGHLVGGTAPGGASDDRFGTQVNHGGWVYPPQPPADPGTVRDIAREARAAGDREPEGGDAEAHELLDNAANATTGHRRMRSTETADGKALGQVDVPGGTGSDRPEPQDFNLPGTVNPYPDQP